MRLALYQPDIAGNVGTILRMTACFGISCDLIHPCGFAFSDRALKRSGMDYAARADIQEHADWAAFEAMATQTSSRIILMSSKASTPLPAAKFLPDDIILMGSESTGVPDTVHNRADARIHIPMRAGFRSLNVSVAAGIALAEGLRQTGQFPAGAPQ
jgi:tRNA (cytidine/uridine-2'-O-)-methyltransferase